MAHQERVRISERTKAGLERTVKANGTKLGRPRTPAEHIEKAGRLRKSGLSYGKIAERMGVSRSRAYQLVQAG